MARSKTNSLIRFWSKVDKRLDNECWNYVAGVDKDGYGQFWDSDNNKQTEHQHYHYLCNFRIWRNLLFLPSNKLHKL